MTNKLINLALILALSMQWSACSTSRAYIKYDTQEGVEVKADAVQGKPLGAVRGNEGGAIWNDCNEKAGESLRELVMQAKDMGANAVGNLKWYATGDSTPSCKKGWGYLIIWPFILTPLFMSTEVEGTAYKVSGHAKAENGLIILPNNPKDLDLLIQGLVATAH